MARTILLAASLILLVSGCSSSTAGPESPAAGAIYINEIVGPQSGRGLVMSPDGATQRVFDSMFFAGAPRGGMMVYRGIDGEETWAGPVDGSSRVVVHRDTVGFLLGQYAELSPDGRLVAIVEEDTTTGTLSDALLVVARTDNGERRSIASGLAGAANVEFSPDGREIAFVGIDRKLYAIALSGGARREIVDVRPEHDSISSLQGVAPHWSPDGTRILVRAWFGWAIVPADGSAAGSAPFGSIPSTNDAAWSPDGSRIALTDRDSIYVTDADFTTWKGYGVGIADAEVGMPQWSPDGRSILFQAYVGWIVGPSGIVDLASGSVRILSGQSIYAFWGR